MYDFLNSIKSVKFYLNHYNSIDRRLFSKIKRNHIYLQNTSSLIISGQELRKVLDDNFKESINKINSIPNDSTYKYADSPFFINQLLKNYKELEIVEIEYVRDKKYSRLYADKLKFDFKIDKIEISLSDFSYSLIEYFKKELYFEDSLNIKNFIVKADELANRIDMYGASENYDESLEPLLQYIESFLDEKIILDNSLVVFELNKYKNHM